jgi:hypothetical protein
MFIEDAEFHAACSAFPGESVAEGAGVVKLPMSPRPHASITSLRSVKQGSNPDRVA